MQRLSRSRLQNKEDHEEDVAKEQHNKEFKDRHEFSIHGIDATPLPHPRLDSPSLPTEDARIAVVAPITPRGYPRLPPRLWLAPSSRHLTAPSRDSLPAMSCSRR